MVGKEGGEGVYIIIVNAGDLRVADDDERKISQGLDAMRETDGKEREGKISGGK